MESLDQSQTYPLHSEVVKFAVNLPETLEIIVDKTNTQKHPLPFNRILCKNHTKNSIKKRYFFPDTLILRYFLQAWFK